MQDVQCALPLGYKVRGRYVVEDVLGVGGFGAVYLVRDMRENLKAFALKEMIGPKGKAGRRFTSQASLLRHLDHPALPRVHEVFSDDKRDRVYMLVDYIAGPNLEEVRQLQPEMRFSLPQVMTLMAPIVQAVAYLHSQHPPLIHRDLKPSNIITPEAGSGAMLVDFGLASAQDSATIAGAVPCGTPGYRAPACSDGGGGPRSDMYALGAVFYLLLTGAVPSDACDRLTKLGDGEPDPLLPAHRVVPTVPTAVAAALHRALSLDSAAGFSTVEQYWEALWLALSAGWPMQPAWEPGVAAPTDEHTELAANRLGPQGVGLAAAPSSEDGPHTVGEPPAHAVPEGGAAAPGPARAPALPEEGTGPRALPAHGLPPAPGPALETGQVFERYRIIRWLGSGAAGESYEAEDGLLLRKVTLKLIHPQSALPDSARRQFFREMQAVSVLAHACLAPVLDFGEIEDRLYIARRYVSSGSLLGAEGRLWFRPPLAVRDALHYGHCLAQALQYMHDQGFVHGALSPSNILVLGGPGSQREAGSAPFLLADVGLSDFVRRFGRHQHAPLPFTAAPEQRGGRLLTPASDQFALAALLYFWLAGRPPSPGTPEEIEQLELTGTVTPPSSLATKVNAEQDGVLLRALSADPADRYPSVLAFADALRGTLAPLPELLPPEPKPAAASTEGGLTPIASPPVQQAPEPAAQGLGQARAPAPFEEVTRSLRGVRKTALHVLFFLVLFVTLVAGLGIGRWFYTAGAHGPSFAASSSGTQRVESSPRPTVGSQPTVAATPVPEAPPFPKLSRSYTGTLFDIPGSVTTQVTVTSIHQQQGDVSGYFSVRGNNPFSETPRSGPFQGTVSPSQEVRFTLLDDTGQATFSFNGSIGAGGSIEGTYCSLQVAAGKCSDYGLWSVAPAS